MYKYLSAILFCIIGCSKQPPPEIQNQPPRIIPPASVNNNRDIDLARRSFEKFYREQYKASQQEIEGKTYFTSDGFPYKVQVLMTQAANPESIEEDDPITAKRTFTCMGQVKIRGDDFALPPKEIELKFIFNKYSKKWKLADK